MSEHTITKEQYDGMPCESYSGIDYPVHRFANFIPIADDKDQHALRESIKAIGLVDSIVIFEDSILDGRHRYAACKAVGVEPRFTYFRDSEEAALQFVLAKNIARRNLTVSQKLSLRSKLLPEIERIREAARANNVAGGEEKALIPGSKAVDTTQQIADMLKVGRATVQRADAVERAAAEFPESKFLQEMAGKMLNGEIGVKTAYVDVSAELDKLAKKDTAKVDPDKQFAKLKSEILKAHVALCDWDINTLRPDFELREVLVDLYYWIEEACAATELA